VELRLPPGAELTEYERESMEAGKGIHVTVDKHFRPLQNKDNDYLIDRAAQKSGKSFSGVDGFGMQDASVQESMGRSRIAPRRTWSRPTTASSWLAIR
jgi:hypothetical protein